MCIFFSFVPFVCIFIFVLSCPNAAFAGVTFEANQSVSLYSGQNKMENFLAECNKDCHCSLEHYDPICGTDSVMYYSPCFAGCKVTHSYESSKVYEDCACVSGPGKNVTINNKEILIHGEREKCSNSCNLLPYLLITLFICMIFTFLLSMPSLAATLRCVAESQKSFALGIQWITVRLLGTIPAPILFGLLIDRSCALWPNSCDQGGACAVYENEQMTHNLLILLVCVKFLSCLFYALAWYKYTPPEDSEDGKPSSKFTGNSAIHENNPEEVQVATVSSSLKGAATVYDEATIL